MKGFRGLLMILMTLCIGFTGLSKATDLTENSIALQIDNDVGVYMPVMDINLLINLQDYERDAFIVPEFKKENLLNCTDKNWRAYEEAERVRQEQKGISKFTINKDKQHSNKPRDRI